MEWLPLEAPPFVEPAVALLRSVRDAWRPALWGLAATQPRTWALQRRRARAAAAAAL